MAKIRNILLIGNAGKGKSTLANVLVETDEFEESSNRVNGTDKAKSKEFEYEGINYRIIDTVGIGISIKSTREILSTLEDKSNIFSEEGLNQILFVTNGRFTNEEVEAFDLLRNVIFDDYVTDYTTIVCTNFSDFENEEVCEKDRQEFQKEIAKRSMALTSIATIYVDNPPMIGRYVSVAKISREASRKVLLNHLKTCQKVYQFELLAKFSKIVDEFNSIIKDIIEAINKFELQYSNNIDYLEKFIIERENLVEKIEKRREEVKEYMTDRSNSSTVSHSVILIGKALAISGLWFPPILVPGVVISAVGLLGVSGSESVAMIKENEAYKSFEESLKMDKEKCETLKKSQGLREPIRRFEIIFLRFEGSEYKKQNVDKKRIEVIENVMDAILGEEIETDVNLEKNEGIKHSTGLKAVRATIENVCKIVPSPLSLYCMYRDYKEIENRTSLDDMEKVIKNWREELNDLEERKQQLNDVSEKIKWCKEVMKKLNVNEKKW